MVKFNLYYYTMPMRPKGESCVHVLVLSDSHGCVSRLRYVLEAEGDCPVVFFLGDGLSDLEKVKPAFPARKFVAVRGNCDQSGEYTSIDDFAYQYIEGHTVIVTHGHRVAVRVTLGELLEKAQGVRADVALYGHTHLQNTITRGGVLFVNPGALCDGAYAVLTLAQGQTDVSFRRCPV